MNYKYIIREYSTKTTLVWSYIYKKKDVDKLLNEANRAREKPPSSWENQVLEDILGLGIK